MHLQLLPQWTFPEVIDPPDRYIFTFEWSSLICVVSRKIFTLILDAAESILPIAAVSPLTWRKVLTHATGYISSYTIKWKPGRIQRRDVRLTFITPAFRKSVTAVWYLLRTSASGSWMLSRKDLRSSIVFGDHLFIPPNLSFEMVSKDESRTSLF